MASSGGSVPIDNGIVTPVPNATSAQTGWDGSIVVLNGVSAGSVPQQGYAQTLTLLPYASGNTTLASGADDSVTVPSSLDNLLVSQSNNLFPALNIAVNDIVSDFPTIDVTTADSSSCANALEFYANISAYPTSTLAKNFTAALNSATSGATGSSSIETAMDTFFAGTQGFTNVTFASYVAAMSYVTTFYNNWANYGAGYTYYMYGGSGTAAGTPSQAKSAGTVTFTQATPDGVPPAGDPTAGYTVVYESGGSSTALTFSGGAFVSSGDVPAIALQAMYMELSQLTGQSSDAQTLVTVLVGTANGLQVVGANWKQPPESALDWLDNIFKSEGFQVFMGFVGIAQGIKLACEGLSWLYGKMKGTEAANGGNPPPPAQAQENVQDAEQGMNDAQPAVQAQADRVGEGAEVPAPQDLPAAQENLGGQLSEQQVQAQDDAVQDEIAEDSEELDAEAEAGLSEQEIEIADDLKAEDTTLKDLDPSSSSAETTVTDAQTGVTGDTTQLSTINEQIGSELGSATEQEIKEDEQADEEEEEEEKEQQEEEEDDEAGDEEGAIGEAEEDA